VLVGPTWTIIVEVNGPIHLSNVDFHAIGESRCLRRFDDDDYDHRDEQNLPMNAEFHAA
jgi:hypothetical protein